MKNNIYLIAVLIIFLSSCKQTENKKYFKVHYGLLKVEPADTILQSYSYSREQDAIEKLDTFSDYTSPIIRTKVKYNNCRYYYQNDTLILDFGESNWLKNFFKLKIHKDKAIVDLKMPAFWDKEYDIAKNIDSIYIKVDTFKQQRDKQIRMKLYLKRHFRVYWKGADIKFTAYEIFDDTCVLRKY